MVSLLASDVLAVRSSVKGVGRAPGFVHSFCKENNIPGVIADNFCVALDELLPSLVEITTSSRIRLELSSDGKDVCCTITQEGEKYDIANKNSITWPAGFTHAQPGTLSLTIIHGILQGIECSHLSGTNVTRLVKSLRQSGNTAEG